MKIESGQEGECHKCGEFVLNQTAKAVDSERFTCFDCMGMSPEEQERYL